MRVITEVYGPELNRKATIVENNDKSYIVNMYQNDILIEARDIKDHSEHFAYDCAENWTTGIIKG